MDRGLGRLDTFLEDSTSFLSGKKVGEKIMKMRVGGKKGQGGGIQRATVAETH